MTETARCSRASWRIIAAALVAFLCAFALTSAPVEPAYAADASLKTANASGFKIVYHLNGGKQKASQKLAIAPGKTVSVSKLKEPKRAGYSFAGWYADSSFSRKATEVQGVRDKSARTLYAKWDLNIYKVKLKPRKGKLNQSYKTAYTVKSRSFALPAPVRAGYKFMGWYTLSPKKRVKKIAHGSTGHKVLYAKWAPIVYSIAYVTDGGKLGKGYSKKYSKQNASVKIPTPTKKGYVFMGWYSNAKKTKRVYTIKPTSKGNKILYAKWRKRVLVAHRGYWADGNAVQNSPEAFQAAKKKGFTNVEMDVRFTSDGVPIICHDEKVKVTRTSDDGSKFKIKVPISSMTYEELQSAKISKSKMAGIDGRNFPTFEEMLQVAKDLKVHLNIHLKTGTEAQVQTLIEYVEAYDMTDKVSWISAIYKALCYVEDYYGEDARLIYMHSITKTCLKEIEMLRAGGADVVLIRHRSLVTQKGLEACKEAGIPLGTWGYETEKEAASANPYFCLFFINGLSGDNAPKLFGK